MHLKLSGFSSGVYGFSSGPRALALGSRAVSLALGRSLYFSFAVLGFSSGSWALAVRSWPLGFGALALVLSSWTVALGSWQVFGFSSDLLRRLGLSGGISAHRTFGPSERRYDGTTVRRNDARDGGRFSAPHRAYLGFVCISPSIYIVFLPWTSGFLWPENGSD